METINGKEAHFEKMNTSIFTAGKIGWLLSAIFLLMPIWLPYLYMGAVLLEEKYVRNGVLPFIALPMLFIVPALGAVPVLVRKEFSVIAKVVFIFFYYPTGLTISFVFGWALLVNIWGP
ncbi:MAG: hypothetical protein PHY50_04575 [Sideroxydans sp.]|nr:hypothetical protein [Sideroxydans sp.]